MQPRRTSSFGECLSTRSPANSTVPFVTSPRSACSRLEMAFRVVVLPAPFAPRIATMPPLGTDSDTPFSTRMTWSYTTSMLLTARMISAGVGAMSIGAALIGFSTIGPWRNVCAERGWREPTRLPPAEAHPLGGWALRSRCLVAGFGALRPAGILLGIVLGGRIELLAHAIRHGFDRV